MAKGRLHVGVSWDVFPRIGVYSDASGIENHSVRDRMHRLSRKTMAERNFESLEPNKLYAECLAREESVLRTWRGLHETAFRLLFLERSIFPTSTPEAAGTEGLNVNERDILERAFLGDRCRAIFSLLKEAPNIDERWELLARWLKQEGALEPKDILPADFIKHLVDWRFRGFSKKDVLYASVVEIWGPYFERLMAEMGKKRPVPHVKEKHLESVGFELESITQAAQHAEIIPAICDWLADRQIFPESVGKPIDTKTIRNAHSRSFGGRFEHTSFFYKSKPPSSG